MRYLLAACVALSLALPAPAKPKPRTKTKVDLSVDRALTFLHNNRGKRDGAWSSPRDGGNVALTSLAVMAFLSAGHVPGEGPYGKAVEGGVRWVLKQQQPSGLLAKGYGAEMYHHGIATLMLAEVAGMTADSKADPLGKEVRKALEKAVPLILKAQRTRTPHRGGWRYQVSHADGSDLSVTGWQVMALRAAKDLGCDVPASTIDEAVAYVQRCQDVDRGSRSYGGFRYMAYDRVTVACTGTGVLALELCGKELHRSPATLRGGGYLIKSGNLPDWRQDWFFYSVYYGAQATFQLGGNYWSTYRPALHKVLLDNQNKSNGSWLGASLDARFGGQVYCTSMAVLALTVEYRFLPIYQRAEEPSDKD